MALKWLRTKQKQILVPVAVVVIISFVFLYGVGGRRRRDYRGGAVVAEVGGRKITQAEYSQYLRILRQLGFRHGPYAPYRYLVRGEAARRAGLRVGAEELRDRIRMIVKGVLRPGPGELTDTEYRRALSDLGISSSEFEKFVEILLLGEAMSQTVASASLVTEDEYYLAYCRERERLTLHRRDFVVSSFEKDVEEPTDEDIRAYYDEHKQLDPELETALATDPEVAVEYAFAEKKLAERAARVLRERASLVRPEGLVPGPLGTALAGLTSAALAAAREGEIRKRYEDQKDRLYKLPEEEESRGNQQGKEADGGEKGEEPKDEPKEGPKEESEPRYRPLDEVRGQIVKRIDSGLDRAAARHAAERVLKVARDPSRFRAFQADSMLAGLGVAALPGAVASAGVRDRVEFMSVCEEAGAVHGVSALLKEEALKEIDRLGYALEISRSAIRNAKDGTGDSLSGATSVGEGCAVWRVADYLAPKTLTFEEARDEIVKRMVHARAEKKAREAATDFIAALVEGTADLDTMEKTRPTPAASGHAEPFAVLGVGEIPEEPVAFEENGSSAVAAESGTDGGESAVMRTALYRVAIVVDRSTPLRDRFRKDKGWRARQERMLPLIRWTFMQEHWRDESEDKAEPRLYRELGKRR